MRSVTAIVVQIARIAVSGFNLAGKQRMIGIDTRIRNGYCYFFILILAYQLISVCRKTSIRDICLACRIECAFCTANVIRYHCRHYSVRYGFYAAAVFSADSFHGVFRRFLADELNKQLIVSAFDHLHFAFKRINVSSYRILIRSDTSYQNSLCIICIVHRNRIVLNVISHAYIQCFRNSPKRHKHSVVFRFGGCINLNFTFSAVLFDGNAVLVFTHINTAIFL